MISGSPCAMEILCRKKNMSDGLIRSLELTIVLGKDLIKLGFVPSEKFKEILDFAFDLQIEDDLSKSNIIEKIRQQYKI